ncbi:MAG: hypothetical protein NC427_06840 [Ruminococcus flavefaciens]|nr:hypothetical protein [Ruminococcus flavefaciens]
MQEKYSMHVIELVRNNGISTMPDGVDQGFLMFDYFDILIHKELKGKDKQYVNYFSIGDTFDDDQAYKVSYKTLSLYCDNTQDRDPFVLSGKEVDHVEGENLSGTPFLGIIQISLCKENYVRADHDPVDVDAFLVKCEEKILNMVEQVRVLKGYDPMAMQLYRSSTTGDFCLVIRTDSVEKIYNVALSLSDSQSNLGKALKVRTYTNVGMECKFCSTADGEGRYATLEEAFVQRHDSMKFALRFSADSDLLYIWEQYQQQGGEVTVEPIRGLFGRYDYLLHINLRQFAEIYPVLC